VFCPPLPLPRIVSERPRDPRDGRSPDRVAPNTKALAWTPRRDASVCRLARLDEHGWPWERRARVGRRPLSGFRKTRASSNGAFSWPRRRPTGRVHPSDYFTERRGAALLFFIRAVRSLRGVVNRGRGVPVKSPSFSPVRRERTTMATVTPP